MKVTYFSLVWLFLLLTAEKAKQNNAFVSPTAPTGMGEDGGQATGTMAVHTHTRPPSPHPPRPVSSRARDKVAPPQAVLGPKPGSGV